MLYLPQLGFALVPVVGCGEGGLILGWDGMVLGGLGESSWIGAAGGLWVGAVWGDWMEWGGVVMGARAHLVRRGGFEGERVQSAKWNVQGGERC